jgi:glycosyltransferase involved in cell wall biosynthesis
MPTTKATVIVPTYMGEKKILTLMRALDVQTSQDFNCVIAVDGSTDDTVNLLRSTATQFNKTIIEQKNLGRSVSRNVGAKHTQGELLVFFDDDMEPRPDSIE